MGLRERLDECWNGKSVLVEPKVPEGSYSTIGPYYRRVDPCYLARILKSVWKVLKALSSSTWRLLSGFLLVASLISAVIGIYKFFQPISTTEAVPAKQRATPEHKPSPDAKSHNDPPSTEGNQHKAGIEV